MPGREYSNGNEYRYGQNGQEKSTEINKNSYTAEFWQYDSRIVRRWNVDPIVLTGESPYLVNGGNPIYYTDPKGDFKTKFGAKWYKFWHGGDHVGKNKYGEWYVSKNVSFDNGKKGDGKGILDEVVVGTDRFYGKGRDAYSTARRQLLKEFERDEAIQRRTELGIWDPNLTQDQARKNFINLNLGVTLPNLILKSGNAAANATKTIINAGEINRFGIPKFYTYVNQGKSVFVSPHTMKHLDELAANGAKLGPEYLKLLGQTFQKSLHTVIDDVLSRGALKFDTPYFSGGNKIIFGAPRAAGELPAVKHFSSVY